MKELFARAKIEDYEEIVVDNNNKKLRHELLTKYPMAYGYPFVTIDEEPIGSLVEVAKWMLKEGLVSAKKDE
tara:strand:- start:862 stop:1077 length:216 start_codon:yes stop_codon:yes gene_type:complete